MALERSYATPQPKGILMHVGAVGEIPHLFRRSTEKASASKAVVAARQQPGFSDETTNLDREPHDRFGAVASNPPRLQSKVGGIQLQMVPEGRNGPLVTNDQNIVQMYAKNVLLSLAFLPMPSIFVVAPSNLFQRVYCRPMRKLSHGQNEGPPWLNGR